jgi:hypothetical protein
MADSPHASYPTMERLWVQLAEKHGLKREVFRAKKGQALIWSANLYHGGSKHIEKNRTRWSQVSHYYFEDCCYYTPIRSDPMYGSVFFREPVCVATGKKHVNRYAGYEVDSQFIQHTRPRKRTAIPEDFNAGDYYAANPDVKAAGANAFEHYIQFGIREKRRLRPE